jgi:hypothetical protein
MTQQIEPIEIFGNEKRGMFLRVHTPLTRDDISKAEVLDIYGNTLFTRILTAKTIEEVAQQLNLKLKTVDNRKKLLTEIMEEDAKDGLYEKETMAQQTAIEWLIDEIEKQGQEMPISFYILCEQAKEMEKQQIIDAYNEAYFGDKYKWKGSEEYYNQTFNK